jgi:pimeloyl-ACP methyl ester carboxylesterase/molybdopterin/thiamine biosynthesis adenylyltransferase
MPKDLYSLCYSRNIGILTKQEQERLASATVVIAGMGGIGSNTAVLLARMGVSKFRLADFDTFDYSNVNRQYGAFLDTVGEPKVEVMEKELRRINPRVEVTLEPKGFTADNAETFLAGADLAVDAIDFYSIEAHLEFHRQCRKRGLYVFMGSPVGFSGCLQVFDPQGMGLEEYCGIEPGMMGLEKQLRYACGVVPNLAHIDYFDVSQGASNTNFLKKTGPSLACATMLAASLVASEVGIMLANRRKPKAIPYTFQFDPYTYRYEKVWLEDGMKSFDVDRALNRLQDRSSLIPLVLKYLYKRRKTRRAKVNGAELYYEVEGQGDNLLLIGPLGSDSTFWARQVQPLARHFQVITFDSRGTGFSTECNESHSTLEIAQDAIALLKKLGVQRTHIVGLALGGLVAQHIAALQPALVNRMVLASTYAKADEAIAATVSRWQQIASHQGMEALFDVCLNSLFSDEYVQDSDGEVDKLRTFFHLNLQDPASFVYQSAAGVRHDCRSNLARITCPVLVLHGEDDRVVKSALGKELAAGIRDSQFKVIEGSPHFLNWEDADLFNEHVCEFLTAAQEDVPVGALQTDFEPS